jgi:hypothetical protein
MPSDLHKVQEKMDGPKASKWKIFTVSEEIKACRSCVLTELQIGILT